MLLLLLLLSLLLLNPYKVDLIFFSKVQIYSIPRCWERVNSSSFLCQDDEQVRPKFKESLWFHPSTSLFPLSQAPLFEERGWGGAWLGRRRGLRLLPLCCGGSARGRCGAAAGGCRAGRWRVGLRPGPRQGLDESQSLRSSESLSPHVNICTFGLFDVSAFKRQGDNRCLYKVTAAWDWIFPLFQGFRSLWLCGISRRVEPRALCPYTGLAAPKRFLPLCTLSLSSS